MKELQELLTKRFSVYVANEFEGYCDFLGVMRRLANFSDFFKYSKQEQKRIVRAYFDKGFIYVDSEIEIHFRVENKK